MAADRLRPWIAHGAFSLILFLITAATYSSLGVVLPAMVKDLGWSWSEAGLGFTGREPLARLVAHHHAAILH